MSFSLRRNPRRFTLITVYINGVPNMVYSGTASILTDNSGNTTVSLGLRDFPELPRRIPVENLVDDSYSNRDRYNVTR